MMRIAICAGLYVLLVGPAAAQVVETVPPVTPTLKREVTVTSDIVRIGDLVDHAGALAATPIFRAPDPGETGAVPAYRVADAVRPYGLTLDTRDISEVVVAQAGHVLTVKDIEATLARALASRFGVGEAKDLTFKFDAPVRPVHLKPSTPADLEPKQIIYDRRSGRFDIMLSAAGSATRDSMLRYAGTVTDTREVMVVVNPIARGELVRQADVALERRPRADTGDGFGAAGDVIGLAARRALTTGQIMHKADLMKPEIVRQNEPVTLVYEMPGILVTMRGKAANSGSEGDVVNVINLQSNRTIQGTVVAPGRVRVATDEARPAVTADPSSPAEPGDAARRINE